MLPMRLLRHTPHSVAHLLVNLYEKWSSWAHLLITGIIQVDLSLSLFLHIYIYLVQIE